MASAPPQQRAGTRPGPAVGMQRWHPQQLPSARGHLLTATPHHQVETLAFALISCSLGFPVFLGKWKPALDPSLPM